MTFDSLQRAAELKLVAQRFEGFGVLFVGGDALGVVLVKGLA